MLRNPKHRQTRNNSFVALSVLDKVTPFIYWVKQRQQNTAIQAAKGEATSERLSQLRLPAAVNVRFRKHAVPWGSAQSHQRSPPSPGRDGSPCPCAPGRHYAGLPNCFSCKKLHGVLAQLFSAQIQQKTSVVSNRQDISAASHSHPERL